MHVAGEAAGHVGDLLHVEVVGRIEVHPPVLGRLQTAVETERIGHLIFIFFLFRIEFAITQAHTVAEGEAPGYRGDHIAIGIIFALLLLLSQQATA